MELAEPKLFDTTAIKYPLCHELSGPDTLGCVSSIVVRTSI